MASENIGESTTRLGTQPITKLIVTFSMPAITANVVNALYNIIDRIVVGRGVGEAALGGLSIVMPLMAILLAFAVLFGGGAANLISLRLGEGRTEDARSATNHCFWLLIITGVLIAVLGNVFLEPLLSLLGAQDGSESLEYGRVFIRIIFLGAIFLMITMGLSNTIRAQGYPMIAMAGLIISVCINTGLVALFIFVLHWGVAGSAWATVIAQACSAIWFLVFSVSKKIPLRLTPFRFRLSARSVLDICSFGSAQAIVQFASSFVIALMNARTSMYGVQEIGAEHGGDIALSGMTIFNSTVMIAFMVVFGFSMGAQPILGYNYGARQFDRVLETYRKAVLLATIVSVVSFVFMHFFAEPIVRLYAPDGSAGLIDFSVKAMRYATIGLPIVGFQIVSAGFFVATGRPNTSLFLSMSRQVVFLIPLIFLLGDVWGLMGVVMSNPISDILASVLTAVYIAKEYRRLSGLVGENLGNSRPL